MASACHVPLFTTATGQNSVRLMAAYTAESVGSDSKYVADSDSRWIKITAGSMYTRVPSEERCSSEQLFSQLEYSGIHCKRFFLHPSIQYRVLCDTDSPI